MNPSSASSSPLPATSTTLGREALVLSPYLVPESLRGRKVVNLGDGFILSGIERLIGAFDPDRIQTTRAPQSAQVRKQWRAAHLAIIAGANQLNDNYTILPDFTAANLEETHCPLVPFGVGIHGEPSLTQRMSEQTRELLKALHRRIAYSSWRCPHTIQYLERELPELKAQFLMTGCPVLYDEPLLNGASFGTASAVIAVTATERGVFWEREALTLEYVARRFPNATRLFVTHQNFAPPTRTERIKHYLGARVGNSDQSPRGLRQLALRLGYKIRIPKTSHAAIRLYRDVDLHFGSRLHAHLHFLSRAKRSYLTGVDGRATGIAEAFGFPICNAAQFSQYEDFDFEQVRGRAIEHFQTMQLFVRSIHRAVIDCRESRRASSNFTHSVSENASC